MICLSDLALDSLASRQESNTIASAFWTTTEADVFKSHSVIAMFMHFLIHFLTHSLDAAEAEIPRIVDLHAAQARPKDEWIDPIVYDVELQDDPKKVVSNITTTF